MPHRAKNPRGKKNLGKKNLLPGTAQLKCDVHFEMRSRKYIHILSFVMKMALKSLLPAGQKFCKITENRP
jgi:hypothetical protein